VTAAEDRVRLTSAQVADEPGLDDWRILFAKLHASFRTADFASALRLVDAIGAAAEEMDHHPDVDLRWGRVRVVTWSHDSAGVTARDVRLARRVSELAAEQGAEAEPATVQTLELALDTADAARVRPFWQAVLGLADSPFHEGELVDPGGYLPTLWFQSTDEHDPPRQRFHLDVRVPPEVAEERVAAALAAGGTLENDAQAPTYWVLADPDGNHACVTTWLGRSH
jgi:4a-hydroxytetrahydrobiopterin dehydratase